MYIFTDRTHTHCIYINYFGTWDIFILLTAFHFANAYVPLCKNSWFYMAIRATFDAHNILQHVSHGFTLIIARHRGVMTAPFAVVAGLRSCSFHRCGSQGIVPFCTSQLGSGLPFGCFILHGLWKWMAYLRAQLEKFQGSSNFIPASVVI